MAQQTRAQLIAMTREFMDAVGSTRWSDSIITTILANVYDEEWSFILNAQPTYRMQTLTLTTDANGQIPEASLSTGSGDSQKNWYRIISVTDGNTVYEQTEFQNVPLGTISNYLPQYPKLYYFAGQTLQILPVGGTQLYVTVSYKPTAINDLSNDNVVVEFPENAEPLLCYNAAYKLLLKGGAEMQAAMAYKKLAEEERADLLDDLARRTTNPRMMAYPDRRGEWGG